MPRIRRRKNTPRKTAASAIPISRRTITPDELRQMQGQPTKPRKRTEEILQVEVVTWLNALTDSDFIFTHPANERKSKIETLRAMRMGQLSGVADLIFWVSGGGTHAIELKAEGNYASENQKKFRDGIVALGHTWDLCRSLGEVKESMDRRGLQYKEPYAAKVLRLGSGAWES